MTEKPPPAERLQGINSSTAKVTVERIKLFEDLRRSDAHQPDVEVAAGVQR
jgi:hypothetical protein